MRCTSYAPRYGLFSSSSASTSSSPIPNDSWIDRRRLRNAAPVIVGTSATAASAMQLAGGLAWLVSTADRLLQRNPKLITLVAPYTTWIFTTGAGTGNVYYSMLPVIEEVSYENGVRPERPLSVSPVASQLGITSSPVSAAMAVMVGLMEPVGFEIVDILLIVIPATAVAILVMALVRFHWGKDLEDDPEYQRRLAAGEVVQKQDKDRVTELPPMAKRSAVDFLLGVATIVLFGLFDEIRPRVDVDGVRGPMEMTPLIQIIMLVTALVIVVAAKARSRRSRERASTDRAWWRSWHCSVCRGSRTRSSRRTRTTSSTA